MSIYGRKPIGTVGYLGGLMSVPEEFCWSFAQLVQYNTEYVAQPNESVHLARATVSFHAFARNDLALQTRGEWLLQLDTDHGFEPDILARMLFQMGVHDISVLTGLYVSKAYPHMPVLYHWNDKDELEQIGDWDPTVQLFQIGSAGGGNLLVKRSVFERIRRELKQEPFDITPPYGEDHSFFLRLKKLGIKAYCAPMIESRHLHARGYTHSDFDRSAVRLNPRTEVGGLIWQL